MKISLTSFVDFVLKSGSAKQTCAKQIKERMEAAYDVPVDYYKRFRDAVIELHKTNKDKKELPKIIGTLPDGKEDNYTLMMNGYKKFLGAKSIKWFAPKKTTWSHGTLEVSINPELGLEWDGQRYLVKLYTKAEKPSKDRVKSILALMHDTLRGEKSKIALLDVRNAKLFEYDRAMSSMTPLAEAEAISLAHLLSRL
jgi:hypothetical protein